MNKIPEIELIFNEIINGSFQGTNKVNQMIILDRIKRIEKKNPEKRFNQKQIRIQFADTNNSRRNQKHKQSIMG
jgi:hypothetical protein